LDSILALGHGNFLKTIKCSEGEIVKQAAIDVKITWNQKERIQMKREVDSIRSR